MQKAIYFNKETELILQENFSKGKWGYNMLSATICKLLQDYIKNKPTLEQLDIKEYDLKNKLFELDKQLKEIKEIKDLLKLEKENNMMINEIEAQFLNDTYKIITKDVTKLLPRLNYYKNHFKKEVNEKEFYELMKKAMEEFPTAKNYREL